MLCHLRVRGFALIDELELPLGPGLTVITGETGAGKSILVEALSLLRGGRSSTDLIRTGAEEAQVEGVWLLDPDDDRARALVEQGRLAPGRPDADANVDASEGLLVRRIVARGGRGRCYLGGPLATLAELSATIGSVIDITSQHDQQSLMDGESQLAIVDAFAGNREILARMKAAWDTFTAARAALDSFDADVATRTERQDFLRFQLRELAEAQLVPGEDDALKVERERIKSAERLAAVAGRGEDQLYAGDDAVAGRIAQIARDLQALGAIEADFSALAERLHDAQAVVDDVGRTLGRYGARLRFDPARLEEIEDRLYLIGRLCRKHGGSISTALQQQEALERQLAALEAFDDNLTAHKNTVQAALQHAESVADDLGRRRRDVARALGEHIDETLRDLGLQGARVEIEVQARGGESAADRLGPTGADRVRFQFAPNAGEAPRPLSRIASGGELSRVMLAVKRALAPQDRAATYVFDEVDTGVGGAVAEVIGRKLKAIAADRQVLAVTHLPQIAAFADHHLRVEKRTRGGRTSVDVTPLGADARREEIARMLGGTTVTAQARAHADDMLARAHHPGTPSAPRRRRKA